MVRTAPQVVALLVLGLSVAASGGVVRVEVPANDAVYSAASGLLYVSVASRAGRLGNTIAAIDPHTGSLVDWVVVGSEPGELALADDGSRIYVGLGGASFARSVDLPLLRAHPAFPLGTDSRTRPRYVQDVAVQPGDAEVVAISLRIDAGVSPVHAGVAVFEGGVARSAVTREHTGSNRIEWSDAPSVLYGFRNESSEFGFRTMSVDSGGVTELSVTRGLIHGFGVDILYSGGYVFSGNGRLVDPVDLSLVGRFVGRDHLLAVAPAPDLDQVHFLDGDDVSTFELSTRELLPPIYPPLPAGLEGKGVVRWGADGLVVMGEESLVILTPDGKDSDADGVEDGVDNCPLTANADQEDLDDDNLGDACDPFPDQADDLGACFDLREAEAATIATLDSEATQLAAEVEDLESEQSRLQARVASVRADNARLRSQLVDEDHDEVLDTADRCTSSPPGAEVDASGCTVGQFCSLWLSSELCRAADWGEPQVGRGDCRWRAGHCVPSAPAPPGSEGTLFLGDANQFMVEARWEHGTESGTAVPLPWTTRTGAFYFFRPSNVELTVKVLDGCALTGHAWIFLSGLTNLGVTVTVRNETESKTFTSPPGQPFETILDTRALPCVGRDPVAVDTGGDQHRRGTR